MEGARRRLLFASDFSGSCRAAVDEVAALAQQLGSEVVVTNVQTSPWRTWFSSRLNDRHRADRLELLAQRFRARGVEARSEFAAEGEVARALVGVAEFERADLIAIGASQRPSLPLRRSTAELLVRHARQPVWVSKPRTPSTGDPTHVLCGVDGSPASRDALLLADDLRRRVGGRLSVVHAIGNPDFNPFGLSEAEVKRRTEEHRATVEQTLAAFVAEAGVPDATLRFLWGEPAEVLCAFAEEGAVDVIVVGRTGKGGLRRVVLGSTASQLLRHPCCSLLLLGEGHDPLFEPGELVRTSPLGATTHGASTGEASTYGPLPGTAPEHGSPARSSPSGAHLGGGVR